MFQLTPLAAQNRDKRGIALDGMLKETDTNLASSTQTASSDSIGIVISYVLRARLYMGAIGGDLTADVPFKLAAIEPGAEPSGENRSEIVEKQQIVAQQKRYVLKSSNLCQLDLQTSVNGYLDCANSSRARCPRT